MKFFFSAGFLSRVYQADGRLVNISEVFRTDNAQAPSRFSNVTSSKGKGIVARNRFVPSTSCVCLLRWKRGRELVHCLYEKPRIRWLFTQTKVRRNQKTERAVFSDLFDFRMNWVCQIWTSRDRKVLVEQVSEVWAVLGRTCCRR